MNRYKITFVLLITYSISFSQSKPKLDLNDLSSLIGKWSATAKDSTFSSVLEYKYSPEKKLVLATNHLYGKEGQPIGVYEGVYYIEVDKYAYFVSGPNGEIHKGYITIKNDSVTHFAKLYPGKSIKSYKSQMVVQDELLYYYANYSREEELPTKVDYSKPLIYTRME